MQQRYSSTILANLLCAGLMTWSSAIGSAQGPAKSTELKKINVISSNNTYCSENYCYLYLPQAPSSPNLKKLRSYISQSFKGQGLAEPEFFYAVNEWVALQWRHDSLTEAGNNASSLEILQSAKKGARYRCQEYAQVLNDLLSAYGYVSRILQVRCPDQDYHGLGAGHVVVEAWCNTLSKWIFLDPQFAIHAEKNNSPMSYYELSEIHATGAFLPEVLRVPESVLHRQGMDHSTYLLAYNDFISNYFGYELTLSSRFGEYTFIVLPLDAKAQYLTFQGVPVDSRVFTSDSKDLYFPVNTTLMLFTNKSTASWTNLFQEYKIKSPTDYIEKMSEFAAKPNYAVHFRHTMPWFSFFEVKVGAAQWKKISGDAFEWNPGEGVSELRVRAVNIAGIRGPETYIRLHYGIDLSSADIKQ